MQELLDAIRNQGVVQGKLADSAAEARDVLTATLPEMLDNITSSAARGAGGKVNTWG